MKLSRKLRRGPAAAVALGLVTVAVAACGSSGVTSPNSNNSSGTPTEISGLKQTGPGLTQASNPSGAKVKGGTVTFAEGPDAAPNYIFPMYSPQYCSTSNIDELDNMLYRPLYWFGNNYSPTVDYNYSIGKQPVMSNGGKTATIHLNNYKWSNGEPVQARDLVFWMNVLKANPAAEWCGTIPNRFPYNVTSYKAVNPSTFQITFNQAYNPTYLVYNELSQLTPMPLAWDKTSLSGPTPSANSTSAPDLTKSGAAKVYSFLNGEGAKITQWGTSPLWKVVDGPWQVSNSTADGQVTLVPNTKYTGPVKPTISKFIEEPFTSDTAEFNEVKSGGPNALTIAAIPAQDQPQTQSVESEGYTNSLASYYGFNYFPLNLNNPTVGHVFRQVYFRQALQHLVDQNGWISSILHNTAVATYSPVPQAPPSTLLGSVNPKNNPYPFSVAAAKKLLSQNGWKVVPKGASYCAKPGTSAGECGAGIKKGETIKFNIDYQAGVEAVQSEMQDLQAQAKLAGIDITLTQHPFADVYSAAVICKPSQAKCNWTSENWGAGWIYGPDYFPTGDDLFQTGAVANYENWSDKTNDQLIEKTITGPQADETANMKKWINYMIKKEPVVMEPTSIGTFEADAGTLISKKLGGYTAEAMGWLTPERWYLTK